MNRGRDFLYIVLFCFFFGSVSFGFTWPSIPRILVLNFYLCFFILHLQIVLAMWSSSATSSLSFVWFFLSLKNKYLPSLTRCRDYVQINPKEQAKQEELTSITHEL